MTKTIETIPKFIDMVQWLYLSIPWWMPAIGIVSILFLVTVTVMSANSNNDDTSS